MIKHNPPVLFYLPHPRKNLTALGCQPAPHDASDSTSMSRTPSDGVHDINVGPLEDATEPRPAGSAATSVGSTVGVALTAGRGSCFPFLCRAPPAMRIFPAILSIDSPVSRRRTTSSRLKIRSAAHCHISRIFADSRVPFSFRCILPLNSAFRGVA